MRLLIPILLLACRAWAGYSYCAPVTFSVHPGSTLTNHPVLIFATGTAVSKFKTVANGGAATSSSGYDIGYFSDSACTSSLSYQLVPGTYVGSTGAGEWWALISSQSSSVDTVIYAGVGNSAVTTDQSTLNTFPTSVFSRVWHLQSIDGVAPFTSPDSTPNSATPTNAQLNNITAPVTVAAAQISNGFTQSTTDSSGFASPTGGTGIPVGLVPVSLSCWMRTSTLNASHATIMAYDESESVQWGIWLKSDGSFCTANNPGNFFGNTVNFQACSSTATTADGSWHYVVGTFDGTSTTKVYIDGSSIGTDAIDVPTIPATFNGLTLFKNPRFSDHGYAGDLDDCRVWNVAPSADYIAAEYANQSDPSTYYTFGTFIAAGGGVKHRVISQ